MMDQDRRNRFRPDGSWSRKTSETIDSLVGIMSPKRAFNRKAFRFAYDAIDKHRTRKKRTLQGGTGDWFLTETSLDQLREIQRDMLRNNPLVVGLLKTERNGVVGKGPKIEARTNDTGLNTAIEAAFKEEMLDNPCEITGKFNFNKLVRMLYLSYRRDGDAAVIFTDDGLQAIEGEQIGTPYGKIKPEHFDIINGVAYSKKTKRVIGYYVGSPSKWGYIKQGSYKNYPANVVHHIFNPDRFSQSRGEPALTSAVKYIDNLCDYIDAELVAAKVNACFSMFVARTDNDIPDPYTSGVSSTGYDKDDNQLEKMEPGTIMYGQPGEKAEGIGQTRPGALFDPFVMRMLTFIGRPLCIPLMLVTLDFSGATFMNARFAYNEARDNWETEQDDVVKPFASWVWRWWLQRKIEQKKFELTKTIFQHEVICKRWPYVDPFKEAKADEQQLKNSTTTRTLICARQGYDFPDIVEKLGDEKKKLEEQNLPDVTEGKKPKV